MNAFTGKRLVCGGGQPVGRWDYTGRGPVLRHADQSVCAHRGAIREVSRDGTQAAPDLAGQLAREWQRLDITARVLRGDPLAQIVGDLAEAVIELAQPPRLGERRCDNCGSPIAEHCGIHMIPCCPGKCPGPEPAR